MLHCRNPNCTWSNAHRDPVVSVERREYAGLMYMPSSRDYRVDEPEVDEIAVGTCLGSERDESFRGQVIPIAHVI